MVCFSLPSKGTTLRHSHEVYTSEQRADDSSSSIGLLGVCTSITAYCNNVVFNTTVLKSSFRNKFWCCVRRRRRHCWLWANHLVREQKIKKYAKQQTKYFRIRVKIVPRRFEWQSSVLPHSRASAWKYSENNFLRLEANENDFRVLQIHASCIRASHYNVLYYRSNIAQDKCTLPQNVRTCLSWQLHRLKQATHRGRHTPYCAYFVKTTYQVRKDFTCITAASLKRTTHYTKWRYMSMFQWHKPLKFIDDTIKLPL